MTRCIECGFIIGDDEVGCSYCFWQAEKQVDTERPPPMPRGNLWHAALLFVLLAIGLVVLAVAANGCAAIQKQWPAFIQCAMSSQVDLVQDVKRALARDCEADELGPQARADLDALTQHWGADVIACIIEQLIDAWLAPGRAAIPRAESQAARRAQLFLAEHDSHPVMLED